MLARETLREGIRLRIDDEIDAALPIQRDVLVAVARDRGFGEGNFRALFESIELDQIRRGVLNDERRGGSLPA